MKSIFTYPNNSATDYIDPDYYGTDTTGFKGRIKELQDGNYKSWIDPVNRPNLNIPVTTVIKNISKYNNVSALEESSGNNTIYKFWEQPIPNITMTVFQEDLDEIDFIPVGGQAVVALTRTPDGVNDALGFYDGQLYDYTGDTWPELPLATPAEFFAYHVSAIGTADQDKLYPKITGQTLNATKLIIGENYEIATVGTTDFTLVGAANNNVGTTFTATGAGSGTGTVDTTGQSYIQPEGTVEEFAIFRHSNQIYYAKGQNNGTWSGYKFAGPSTYNSTYWQNNPSYVTNYLLSNPTNGAIGDISAGYQNAGALSGQRGSTTDLANMIVAGFEYSITATGTADFTTIGAANNNLGTIFTATASTLSGTGGLRAIGNNNKVLKLNGPGGPTSGGDITNIILTNDLTTFPVELWDGTLTDGTWTELPMYNQGGTGTGLNQLTNAQYATLQSYAVGSPAAMTFPVPTATYGLTRHTHYGYAYVNLEMTSGSITSGFSYPVYNATDYPANISQWDKLMMYSLIDFGVGSVPRYGIEFMEEQHHITVSRDNLEYNGYLTTGRKYYTYSGGNSASAAPNTWAAAGATSVSAGNFVIGEKYVIENVGDTNWAAIGAAANNSGWVFTATGVGSGTGTATEGVFTATNAGTYVDLSSGQVGIYPQTGIQPRIGIVPDPWNNQSIDKFVAPSGFINFQLSSGSATGKLRVGFIKPTMYNAEMLSLASQSFTGDMTIDASETNRFRTYSSLLILPGNTSYMQRTGESTYVSNPRVVDNKYYVAGTNGTQLSGNIGDLNVQSNGNGYINGVTLNSRDPGEFPTNSDVTVLIETTPNTYTPPAPTPIEQADTFDTEDQWTSNGFTSNPAKEWPRHVTPMSAEINYSAPTITNNSQSGIKYTRSAGHTKWQLDVVYPPMSAADFKEFNAIAQAAHGQSTPFFFNLISKNNDRILWKDFYDQNNTTTTPRFKDPIVAGDTLALFEGFASNEANAFMQGEVFIDGGNENGNLHTSLSGTAANVYGEAKIRTPWPFRSPQGAGNKVFKDPFHAVVTLADDNFTWSVDVNNYYYVSVSFDLDNWK